MAQLPLSIEKCSDKISQYLFIGLVSWYVGGILGCIGLLNGWLAFITLWVGASLINFIMSKQTVDSDGKAILITGCDTGFGHNLAIRMDTLGYTVFAGCLLADRKGEGAEALRKIGSKNLHVLQLNILSEAEIKAAREQVDNLLPKGAGLWAIVNNAGLSTFGDLEWVSMPTFKRIADVNLFGMIFVIKTFLPLVKRSKGRVVNVASMMGRMSAPMRSAYTLTKYGVEGMSDCLRQEMKPWGVNVIIIEPGNFIAGTAIFSPESVARDGEEMWKSMSEEVRKDIGEEYFNSRIELMKTYVTCGNPDTSPVIQAYEEAITQKYPQARYQPICLYYKLRVFISTHFYEWFYDNIYS